MALMTFMNSTSLLQAKQIKRSIAVYRGRLTEIDAERQHELHRCSTVVSRSIATLKDGFFTSMVCICLKCY